MVRVAQEPGPASAGAPPPAGLSPDMTEDPALHVPWGRTHGAVSSQGQGIKDRDTVAPHPLQILQR